MSQLVALRVVVALGVLALVACSSKARPDTNHSTRLAATPRVVENAEYGAWIDDAWFTGVVALLSGDAEQVVCSSLVLCEQRVVPASTFKIPNALIGLETGVIRDAAFTMPWDGVVREVPDWNHDHDLRSAIQVSAVWYFQELARRVGRTRMAEQVTRLDYGNHQVGERVDKFWLEGPLAISPVEQVAFLRRLARGQLGVSARSMEIVRDLIVLAEHDGIVLRGKTGWSSPGEPDELGWFVGYVEDAAARAGADPARTYVAVLLRPRSDVEQDSDGFRAARRAIAERALHDVGAW